MNSDLLNKSCRLCLSDGEEEIFEHKQSPKELSLAAKVMVCLSLPVSPSDDLPKFVCFNCLKLVNDFFNFREACWNSHILLIQFKKSAEKQSEVSDNVSEIYVNDAEEDICRSEQDSSVTKENTNNAGTQYPESTITSYGSGDKKEDNLGVMEQMSCYELEIDEDPDNKFPVHSDCFVEAVSVGVVRDQDNKTIEHLSLEACHKIKMPSIAVSGVGHLKCYKCSNCVKVFPSMKALNKHENICLNEVETLEDESESSELESEILKPSSEDGVKVRSGRKHSYPCPTCGKVFKVPAVLRNHMKIHTGERPFLCSLCSRSFRQLGALRNHEMKHSGTSTHPCKICGKGFFRPSDLEKHIRSHTGERPYMCSVCSKTFHQLSGLLVHERIHTGERPYSCAICPATFNQWANKQRHEKTHEGGAKPFTCNVCYRKYSDHKEMELHQATHSGGRPHLCHFCEKGFRKPSELRDHLRRFHTNERPYECEICSKRFCFPREVKQHLLVHTGERPFKCNVCPRSFAQKGNLRRHQLRHEEDGPSIVLND